MVRLHDRALAFAWLTRLGVFSILIFVMEKIIESWSDCLRCLEGYGIRWFEIPAVLAWSPLVHALEALGMWMAFRGSHLWIPNIDEARCGIVEKGASLRWRAD